MLQVRTVLYYGAHHWFFHPESLLLKLAPLIWGTEACYIKNVVCPSRMIWDVCKRLLSTGTYWYRWYRTWLSSSCCHPWHSKKYKLDAFYIFLVYITMSSFPGQLSCNFCLHLNVIRFFLPCGLLVFLCVFKCDKTITVYISTDYGYIVHFCIQTWLILNTSACNHAISY